VASAASRGPGVPAADHTNGSSGEAALERVRKVLTTDLRKDCLVAGDALQICVT